MLGRSWDTKGAACGLSSSSGSVRPIDDRFGVAPVYFCGLALRGQGAFALLKNIRLISSSSSKTNVVLELAGETFGDGAEPAVGGAE